MNGSGWALALRRPRSRWLWLACVPALLVGAVGVVHFPEQPGQAEISAAFTVAMAAPAFVTFVRALGVGRGLVLLALLSAFGFGIEGYGVATGWPYGRFHYGEALGPKLLGLVPLTLPFSWVPLVLAAVALASAGRSRRHPLGTAFIATAYLVAFDLMLDPAATRLGFWIWEGGANRGVLQVIRFYDVPLSNFLGWLVSSFVASLLLLAGLRLSARSLTPSPGLLGTWALSLVFWIAVNLLLGFVTPALVGGGLAALTLAKVQTTGVVGRGTGGRSPID